MRKNVLLVLSLLGITAACREEDQSPTAPDTSPALATTTATLVFDQLSAGSEHTCGVTSDDQLFCWGRNNQGQLGDGTTADRHTPVQVAGTLRFRQVSAGFHATCALTTDSRTFCWGANAFGQLGDGTTARRLKPTAVLGGRVFRQVEIYDTHTCAVAASNNRAFCWGENRNGQLGIGNNTGPEAGSIGAHSTKPVAVIGSLAFRHITAGHVHTCAVTTDDRVFCWGYNRQGQVGDGSSGWLKLKPTLVAGSRRYSQVDAGDNHTCAVTTADRAFCWGNGSFGVLGNGTQRRSGVPTAVSGGLSFSRVTAGALHTCAETPAHRAYCWGDNSGGNLGTGDRGSGLTPVAVVGGLSFLQVSAGGHSCGKTAEGTGYCWGANFYYELGNGTRDDSTTPVAVSGPM